MIVMFNRRSFIICIIQFLVVAIMCKSALSKSPVTPRVKTLITPLSKVDRDVKDNLMSDVLLRFKLMAKNVLSLAWKSMYRKRSKYVYFPRQGPISNF